MSLKIDYQNWHSYYLNRDMAYKVYGHQGKPVLVFPTSRGRFFQFEDSGMLDAMRSYIEQGRIQVWACDGIDGETFFRRTGTRTTGSAGMNSMTSTSARS
jgi:esterase/lipase superfamily enzyme